jgi:predicted transposase YbfD/YdcC
MGNKLDLHQHFAELVDYRVAGRCLHGLSDILLLILCGVIADCDDFAQIHDYGKDQEAFLKQELGLDLKNGIPSEDTLWRAMRWLKPEALQQCLQACYRAIGISLQGKHLCIDGKELRGTVPAGKKHALVQLVSVWVAAESLSFGQLAVETKSNEITAIPALLELLDCAGATITMDAIGCQKDIAEKIIARQADYIIGLKQNQGQLYEQVSQWLEKQKPALPCYEQWDKDHGRGERRKVYVCQQLDLLEATQEWEKLQSVVMVETVRIGKDQPQTSTRYYISSLKDKAPQAYAGLIRGHWQIENKLHWQLDMSFGEDACQLKKDNAPQNMSAMRKLALFIMGKDNSISSIKRKRKKAARDNNFLVKLFKYP